MIRSRRSPLVLILFAVALCLAGLVPPASAQVQTGTPPFGSFGGGPDVINLANLNSHITIPVLHKPGRGQNFTYDLSDDTSVWFPVGSSGSQSWQPVANFGWRGQTEAATGYISYFTISGSCPNPPNPPAPATSYSGWTFHDAFGVAHPIPVEVMKSVSTFCPLPSNATGTARDGSGYTMTVNVAGTVTATMTSSAGKVLNVPLLTGSGAATATDRNGNQLTVDGNGNFYDTLSGTVPVLVVAGLSTPASPVTFTYTAPSGASAVYTAKYSALTIQTNFGCSGITDYGPTSNDLITEIDLPDGSKYTFTYEPTPGHSGNFTGRLASMTLPTGGTISYAYSGGGTGVNGISCADGSAATLTRTTPDGQWTYAQVKGSTAPASTTTITAPQLPYDSAPNQTVIQFQGIYETQRQVYQGFTTSGTLLRQWSTCYNGNTSNCNSTAIALPITRRTVIDQYGSSGPQCKHDYFFNSFGGLTEQDDYDYGSGAPGPLLKKSLVTFASLGVITAFRQTVTICNGTGSSSSCAGPSGGNTGTVVAQTNYNYDQPNTLTTTSGIAQHTSVSGSRGNLTSTIYPVSALTSHFTYYDTGSPNTSQDINGATTTFNYSSNANSCQMAFPTSLSEPLSLSRSMTLNCTGGVATQVTDENGNNASTSYTDAFFWRPASSTDQTSATTSLTYTAQTAAESALTFNSGNSTVDSLVNFDSLGRPHVQQTRQSPGATTFDSVESDYDVLGRPNRSTLPYSGTAGQTTSPTAPGVVATYDALSRPLTVTDGGGGTTTYSYSNNGVPNNDVLITIGPAPAHENVKKRQLEYDSIGRLTSVCEITGASGSGTCSQGSQQTGYWTKYTYDALGDLLTVTQNAQAAAASQQTRTYTYDAMGRLLSEKNPETSQAAITYAYDSDSTCTPASDGDLVKRIDPNGNTTCYTYDALHRRTSVVYSGSNSTPNKYFVYDSATVNSVAMSNAKTQLAEAYTATSSTGTKITDVGLSYSKRGELTDVYESTPHSGTTGATYNHTSAQFWPNGALNVLTGPGIPTMTYAPDGEGRTKTISASSGKNPVTATTYNTASLPTAVTLGSNDSDAFQYDSNTLRETQYQFNVGAQSVVGKLGWNANSSLGSLDITDPFDSSDTQNCSFSADDLSRVATANCGTIWGQSFTYDAFGNVSKQVLSGSAGTTFLPTYATSPSITNQIASLPGGVTPTYDKNGNSLNDSFNTYTWDADNNAVSVVSGSSTVSLTYDAFDRMVEQARGTTYTQIVYSPLGSKLSKMNGTTLQSGYVPLTSGASAIYNSSGLAYYRHTDHLGSSRFASTPSQTMYSDTAYSAFGEPYAQSGTTDVSFTGQDQDTVPGVNDFLFRKYSPAQGRWTSPDPAGLGAVDPSNPQSWNRYAYVLNSPLSNVDPTGLACYPLEAELGLCGDGGGGGIVPCGIFGTIFCGPPGSGLPCAEGIPGCDVPPILLPPIGIGGGGGGSPGQSGPTPIPAPPVDVGDPGLGGTGPIWNEQIPIGGAPTNPFLIIVNFGTGASGGDPIFLGPDATIYVLAIAPFLQPRSAPPVVDPTPGDYSIKHAALRYFCGQSSDARLLKSIRNGAVVGATNGAYAGFFSGEIFGGLITFGATGPAGAATGAFVGGTIGAARGVFTGTVLALACRAVGAYD